MMADSDARVCPRCGNPADDNAYCTECGHDLKAAGELPTRAQWVEGLRTPSGEPAAPPPGQQPRPEAAAPPAPAPSRRPSFLQPVPLLILGAGLIAATILVIVISSGGGGISSGTVETRLEALLAAAPYGADRPSVECPGDVEVEVGNRFECDASAEDGTTARLEVTVTSAEGEGRYRVDNLVPVEAIATECRQELTEIFREFGTAQGCELECPDLVEADPNGVLTCKLTVDGQGGSVRIDLGSDGTTAEGTWEAVLE